MKNIAVMVSGTGRLLDHVVDLCSTGVIDAKVNLVIASRDCPAAEKAIKYGCSTRILKQSPSEELMTSMLDTHKLDLVISAGYLLKINIPKKYADKIINVHPSLLPKFGGNGMYGARVHQAVLDAKEIASGCTVHLVTEDIDKGPILLQKICEVLPNDDCHSLAARVFWVEKRALTEVLKQMLQENE